MILFALWLICYSLTSTYKNVELIRAYAAVDVNIISIEGIKTSLLGIILVKIYLENRIKLFPRMNFSSTSKIVILRGYYRMTIS